ncbi:hypothetical protein [Candidatus Poriferisodalis sp.]|uniref:hypothetical protein n=1 Tax=Candidatus Poriferisodalis sp. TaxID=3101277 RepID=UPI003B028635
MGDERAELFADAGPGGQPASIMARRSLSCLASDAPMAMRTKGHITRHNTIDCPATHRTMVLERSLPRARNVSGVAFFGFSPALTESAW